MRYQIVRPGMLILVLTLCGLACGTETGAELKARGLEALRAAQTDPDRIVEAAKWLARASDALVAEGNEASAEEANACLYWAKKKMTVQQIDAFLAKGADEAKTVVAKMEAIEKKEVKPQDAALWLARADGYAEGQTDAFLVAIKYFELANRFMGAPEGMQALQKCLKYLQRANLVEPTRVAEGQVPGLASAQPAQRPAEVADARGAAPKRQEPEIYQAWPFAEPEAKRRQKETAQRLGTMVETSLDLGNAVKLELVLIPAGRFMMGIPETEEKKPKKEMQHEVTLSKPFLMGKYEVTVGQFRCFAESTGYRTEAEKGDGAFAWVGLPAFNLMWEKQKALNWQEPGFKQGEHPLMNRAKGHGDGDRRLLVKQSEDHPVVNISWNDAQAFCRWLSQESGREVRLPTEAEWEYAARAGTETQLLWGDDPEGGKGWGNSMDLTMSKSKSFPQWKCYDREDGYVFTAPVGKFRPNGYGLYDMIGNAFEWCQDWHGDYWKNAQKDPTGAPEGTQRVLRGGSWRTGLSTLNRVGEPSDCRRNDAGFRVAVACNQGPVGVAAKAPTAEAPLPRPAQRPPAAAPNRSVDAGQDASSIDEKTTKAIDAYTRAIQYEQNAAERVLKQLNVYKTAESQSATGNGSATSGGGGGWYTAEIAKLRAQYESHIKEINRLKKKLNDIENQ